MLNMGYKLVNIFFSEIYMNVTVKIREFYESYIYIKQNKIFVRQKSSQRPKESQDIFLIKKNDDRQ